MNYYIENGSMGFHTVGRILRRRKWMVALGLVIGLVLAAGYALLAPKTYTASALVHLTAVSADGMGRTGGSSNGVDMVTERQLAASAATADAAVKELGAGWTRVDVMDGVEITGGSDGAVLRVNFTADSEARAREGAMGIADAYLTQRTTQAQERNAAIEETIDEEIASQRSALRTLLRENPRRGTSVQLQEESIRQTISALQQRKFELGDVFGKAGDIITPAEANPVYASPSVVGTLAVGALGGLALGLVLALCAHGFSRRPGDATDVELLTGAPVWRQVDGTADERWELAASHTRRAAAEHGSVALVVDGAHSSEAAGYLGTHTPASAADIADGWAKAIDHAAAHGAAVAVVPVTWDKKRFIELSEDLAMAGATLVGVVLTSGK